MFTGIIQAVGSITVIDKKGGDARVRVKTGQLDMSDVNTGDSIAVSGVCLTVVEYSATEFTADVSGETLSRTTVSGMHSDDSVNLEKALTLGAPLGGHLVSGHVDGLGTVISRAEEGRSARIEIQAPDTLARYIAEKGSICVDGVSLTVNAVSGAKFYVNIVPHTLAQTTLGRIKAGNKVNLEVDLLARYLERLMLDNDAAQYSSSITREFLAKHGYVK